MDTPGYGWSNAIAKSKRKLSKDDPDSEYLNPPGWSCLCSVHALPKWHFKVSLLRKVVKYVHNNRCSFI